MSFARATFGAMPTARTTIVGARPLLVRRGYSSSEGNNAPKSRNNLQLAVGAAVVAIPMYWYFIKSTPQEAHHVPPSHKSADLKETAEGVKPQDKAAASKPPGDWTTQSGKQEKLSNDDTKHSRDIGRHSPLSQKGKDIPESSKLKGTVDVGKP
ncbi:hypothetical protein V493_00240 [Pseudogymnoascus sp. VKM F-4281 (FW-2241)]|nr:hypothetical protein V493_00240 [Pseudogymnoascus sp. VKM F-4281 (FW-2241)]